MSLVGQAAAYRQGIVSTAGCCNRWQIVPLTCRITTRNSLHNR